MPAQSTPGFVGVFWDSQNVPLESIERIEVIRGPGAAVWGSNAVNGVINIITKSAVGRRAALFDAGAGNAIIGPEAIRYGGKAHAWEPIGFTWRAFMPVACPRPRGWTARTTGG